MDEGPELLSAQIQVGARRRLADPEPWRVRRTVDPTRGGYPLDGVRGRMGRLGPDAQTVRV